jgi:hypothetical protein
VTAWARLNRRAVGAARLDAGLWPRCAGEHDAERMNGMPHRVSDALGLLVSLVIATAAAAQPTVPVAPVPGGVQAPAPPPGLAGPGVGVQPAPTVAGQVQQYLLTPHGEVDGLLLSDGTVVKFPPHLGSALTSAVGPGDPVTVIGFLGVATPHGRAMRALTITNTRTGRAVVDQPPPARPMPPHLRGLALTAITVSGTVSRVLVTPAGDVDGVILSGGEQVKLRPGKPGKKDKPDKKGRPVQAAAAIATVLERPGTAVTATGAGTRNAFGTVVAAETLTVDGPAILPR